MGLAEEVAKVLGGTASKTIGGALDSVTKTADDLFHTQGDKDKEQVEKDQVSQEEQKESDDVTETLTTDANTSQDTVNTTMQAESKSEHWAQWIWRPIVGFTFCAVLINNYILLPYFNFAKQIVVPDQVWYAFLAILGVSAAGRSVEKWQTAKNNG